MHEGYMALLVAILKNCTPEMAWMYLEGKTPKYNRKWLQADIDQMDELRAEGITWREIGEMFNTSATAIERVHRYWKRKVVINDN